MSQLRTASDQQRQQILKEMDQLRTQLRDQISQFREQAQQQAEQMRTRLGNNRDAILNQGAGGTGGGRDR
jgi:F0F1-type ATP synthase membrane subunit b/b'